MPVHRASGLGLTVDDEVPVEFQSVQSEIIERQRRTTLEAALAKHAADPISNRVRSQTKCRCDGLVVESKRQKSQNVDVHLIAAGDIREVGSVVDAVCVSRQSPSTGRALTYHVAQLVHECPRWS